MLIIVMLKVSGILVRGWLLLIIIFLLVVLMIMIDCLFCGVVVWKDIFILIFILLNIECGIVCISLLVCLLYVFLGFIEMLKLFFFDLLISVFFSFLIKK